ncbi:hypothetical protein KIPB_008841 [Kipferlia bialata]|uniref:Uncharacterized protein n=1 Tax=Kipferlia bialata TaxID=797122 RepID=A0A391NT90_9EUKA|nr:hypothetical protein KIPB_008841 [Kipferlia bialata]|eukprot:g8841.t1
MDGGSAWEETESECESEDERGEDSDTCPSSGTVRGSDAQGNQETEALSTHVPTVSLGREGVTLGGAVPHMCPRDPLTLLDGYTHPDYSTQTDARDAVIKVLHSTLGQAKLLAEKRDLKRIGELKRAFILVWLLDQDGLLVLPQRHMCKLLRCNAATISMLFKSTPAERLEISVTQELAAELQVAAPISAADTPNTDRDGVLDDYTHPDYPTQREAREAVLTALQATLDDARQCMGRGEPTRAGEMKRAFITQWLLRQDRRPLLAQEPMTRLLRCDYRTIASLYSPAGDKTSRKAEALIGDLWVFNLECIHP